MDWPIEDAALALVLGPDVDVCAKAPFDVVAARTRNPAAIIAATMLNNFVVLIFCYLSMYK